MAKKKRPASSSRGPRSAKGSKPPEQDLRVRIRDLTLQCMHERNLKLGDLSQLGDEVLERAAAAIRDAVPKSRSSALRQAVDGFADAWAAAAKAGASAVRHARDNGARSAERDLKRLAGDLRGLEENFFATLDKYAKRLRGDVAEEFQAITSKVRRTGTAIRPAVQSAGRAVLRHPLSAAGDLVGTGMKLGASAVGGALLGAGGLLEGLGRSLGGKGTKTKAAPKKAAAKKPSGKR